MKLKKKRFLVFLFTVCFILSIHGIAFASDLVSDVIGTTSGVVNSVTGLVSPVTKTVSSLTGTAVNTATNLAGEVTSLPGQILQVVPLPAVSELTSDVIGLVPQTVDTTNKVAGAVLHTASDVVNATAGLADQTLNATSDLIGKTLGTVNNLVGSLLGSNSSTKPAGTIQLPATLPQTGADIPPYQVAGLVLIGLGIYLKRFF